ncbi:hypothetical protein PtB15_13B112 [Puccinia triticina]|nr:hypothetical protein PtB15_13B112 [Puccinia triticina]
MTCHQDTKQAPPDPRHCRQRPAAQTPPGLIYQRDNITPWAVGIPRDRAYLARSYLTHKLVSIVNHKKLKPTHFDNQSRRPHQKPRKQSLQSDLNSRSKCHALTYDATVDFYEILNVEPRAYHTLKLRPNISFNAMST